MTNTQIWHFTEHIGTALARRNRGRLVWILCFERRHRIPCRLIPLSASGTGLNHKNRQTLSIRLRKLYKIHNKVIHHHSTPDRVRRMPTLLPGMKLSKPWLISGKNSSVSSRWESKTTSLSWGTLAASCTSVCSDQENIGPSPVANLFQAPHG